MSCVAAASSGQMEGKTMSQPANIVYLMFDQLKASATGLHGNPWAQTRFLDEMAEQGIAFMDAYSPASICTPSRTSVMTGVQPLVHQCTCHQNRAPCNLRQLPEFLVEAGYYTAGAGHLEANRNLLRGYLDTAPSDELGAMRKAYSIGVPCGRADVGWSSGTRPCPAEAGHSSVMTDRVLHQVDSIEALDAPFFLHVAYEDPHPCYFVPPPYDTLVDPESLPLPEPGDAAARPAWQDLVREQLGTEQASPEDIRKLVAVYYGMAAYADDQMRRLYSELERRGLLDNTWIIIGADHGDYTGEKGLFMKSESLYECLLHVPLVIVPPRNSDLPRGQKAEGLVDLTDLFPTILGIADIDVPDYTQGRDLISWVSGGAAEPLRDVVFSQVGEYHGALKTTSPGGIPESGRHPGLLQGARTATHSFVHDPDYGDEAYDLQRDPKELCNLLQTDAASELPEVAELRQRQQFWEADCLALRAELGVVPGYRGFDTEGLAADLYLRP